MNPVASIASQAISGVNLNGMNLSSSSLTHQANGATFSFKLPEPPAPISTASAFTQNSGVTGMEPTSWGQMVQRMVTDVNSSQETADAMLRDALAGGKTSIQDAMVAMQESSVKFELLSQVRNKAIDAYQEIMRMHV